MNGEAPRVARALVRLVSPRADRDFILEDLRERFEAIARERSPAAARRWYWFQALRAVQVAVTPDLDLMSRRSWQGVLGDIRQGARVLRRKPLYTAGVTGTLAIGLASAAAVSSVAWHVWLAPMPFPDPDRVVRLFELEAAAEGSDEVKATPWRLSPPLLEDLRAHDWTTVSAVAGVSRNVFDWKREDRTSRITALVVSPEVFDILGFSPLAGRVLSLDEDAPEVVLTEAFWERAYGSDPGIIGSGSLNLSGKPYSIVGVVRLPSGYPDNGEVIMRMAFAPEQLSEGMRGARYLDVVARVDPAHSVVEASAEMNRIVVSLGETFANHRGWGGNAVSLSEELMRPYRSVIALLLAAGVVFLLLAVVNVAGLVAARSVDGRHDRSIRLALGASERRLLRASLTEAVLVGAVAGGLALFLAYGLLTPLMELVPAEIPRVGDVRLSAGVGGAMLGLALLSGWVVGLLGFLLSRGVAPAIGRSAIGVGGGLAARSAMVASQVALTTLLAATGAGIVRHVMTLQNVDLGFEAEGVASAEIMVAGERYQTPETRSIYWGELLQGLRARGVEVAIGASPPMAGVNMPWGYRLDPTDEQRFAQYNIVSAEYFDVMGIDVIEGRAFTDDDRVDAEPVVVINETLATERFPNESAVGRQIEVLLKPKTVVGVVRAARHWGPGVDPPEQIYVPYEQDPWPHSQLLVHGDAQSLAATVVEVTNTIDPGLGVPPIAPYTRFVTDWFAALRLQMIIVGVLALVGTVLAALGLYALIAYRVNTQRREIGLRMALGASDVRMFSDVVRRGATLSVAGMVVGFLVWYAAMPVMGELLGDVAIEDPWVPLIVATLVGLVSIGASVLPALRSVAVDPAVTLRAE